MNSMQNTPGPWHLKHDGLEIDIISDFKPLGVIARVFFDSWAEGKATRANANLIASAPDLLKAALMAKTTNLDGQNKVIISEKAYSALCAAIAKAKGD